ncbi:MAG: ABC transporter ATP-binding protein [Pseudomonadota bacterium]
MAKLDLSGVAKAFGTRRVLNDVNLSIQSGEFLVIVGPSGCGKSTLLRIVAGLEGQDAGEIRLGGEPIDALAPKERDVAMVFQSYALYPHMTVAENLALPLVMRNLNWVQRLPLASKLSSRIRETRKAVLDEVSTAAESVALGEYLHVRPKQLSGGQRQRVALARALVRRPRLFLLDEPLSNLDAALRSQTRVEIVDLQRRLDVTTIYVTHDQVEAMTMADRIAVMMDGEIVQLGSPRDLHNAPADTRVARFIGTPTINMLPGHLDRGGIVRLRGQERPVARAASRVPAGDVEVGIRAEHLHLTLSNSPEKLPATVRTVEYLGSDALVHLAADMAGEAHVLVARVSSDTFSAAPGTKVWLSPTHHVHVFGADGDRIPVQAVTRVAEEAVAE